MTEYIEREAAIAAIMSEPPDAHYPHWYADKIKPIPAADVAPVRHGRWISNEGDVLFHCSECETQISTSWDYDDLQWCYCTNCGARMDGYIQMPDTEVEDDE